jgi:hypothetical protein
VEKENQAIDPIKDLQSFIQKSSTFSNNERLKKLYKEADLYVPYTVEGRDESTSFTARLSQGVAD